MTQSLKSCACSIATYKIREKKCQLNLLTKAQYPKIKTNTKNLLAYQSMQIVLDCFQLCGESDGSLTHTLLVLHTIRKDFINNPPQLVTTHLTTHHNVPLHEQLEYYDPDGDEVIFTLLQPPHGGRHYLYQLSHVVPVKNNYHN